MAVQSPSVYDELQWRQSVVKVIGSSSLFHGEHVHCGPSQPNFNEGREPRTLTGSTHALMSLCMYTASVVCRHERKNSICMKMLTISVYESQERNIPMHSTRNRGYSKVFFGLHIPLPSLPPSLLNHLFPLPL
jgi:hypothetical protein